MGCAVPDHRAVLDPYVIALYPGVMWYDTSNQLLQWNHLPNLFTDGQLTDHHPIADTVIWAFFCIR